MLVGQRVAYPSYHGIPLPLFRGGIVDQNAIHMAGGPVATVVPDPVVPDTGYYKEV